MLPPDRDALRGVATLALLRSVAQLTAQVKVSEHLVDLSKDRVEAIEDALGTTDDLLEPLALLAQHVGSRALKLFMSGDAEGALSTLQLLAKNRGLFGMNAAQARRAIKSLDGLMKAPQGPAAAAKVWDFKAQTSSFEGPASNALQALAVAFALPGLIADGTGLKDGSPEERANLVGDFLGNGGDGVSLVSSILNGANLTETVANMTSGVGGLIGAVLDGREAILDAKAHKAWMSVTHATSSVGGSILAAQAFPFIPQILSGAESAVAGVALGAFALGSEYARKAMLENRLERATAVYLMGAGVDSKPATELSRIVQGRGIEPFVQVAAKKLRVTPLDLFEKLLAQPEWVQKEFARIALSTRLAPAKGLREKLAAKATIKKPYTVDQGLAELRKLGFEPGPTR